MKRYTLREQIALWTFDGAKTYAEGEPITPRLATSEAHLKMFNQEIDDDGMSGTPFIDANGVPHYASRALAWNDIKGSGPDAKLYIELATVGWEQIRLRFDYRAETADSFDLHYRTSDSDDWEKIRHKHRLVPDYRWHETTVDLSDNIEGHERLTLCLNEFDRNGNDHLVIDNLEITGVRSDGHDYPPRVMGLPEAIGAVIGASDQPPYRGDGNFLFHVSHPDAPPEALSLDVYSTNDDILSEVKITPVQVVAGVYRLEVGEPAGEVGVTEIVIQIAHGSGMVSTTRIPYGASAELPHEGATFFAGVSNISAAIDIDEKWMMLANDEDNVLRVYPKQGPASVVSAIPLTTDEPDTHPFYLTDTNRAGKIREMDIEAVARVHDRVYWMGSHSNNDDGDLRPNRHRLFATDLRVYDGHIDTRIVGHYSHLRQDLAAWGDTHNYDLSAAMAEGVGAKEIDGMNIEGFAIGPDGKTALIGFRAPLVPPDDRKYALLAPIHNFSEWFNNGHPVRPAALGDPIELDLGGRGVRAMQSTSHGIIIIAGPVGEDGTFALFTWSGDPDDTPQQRAADLSGMRPEGLVGIRDEPFTPGMRLMVVSDNGDADWYDTGHDSEDLIEPMQKFTAATVELGEVVETTRDID